MGMWGHKFRDTWLNAIDTPQEYLYVQNALVDFETGIVSKDGKIIWETANENIVWQKKWVSSDPRWLNRLTRFEVIMERMLEIEAAFNKKVADAKDIPEIKNGTTLHLLHPFNRYVFGHLFDTLQKLYIPEIHHLSFHSILLPKTHEIIDFNTHLKVFGMENKHLFHSDYGLIKVNHLLFIPPISHPTSFTPESFLFVKEKYENFYKIKTENAPSNQIFLTRKKGHFKRHLLNEDEIKDAMLQMGVIYFDGNQTFDEMISAFSNASHVAGVHGSLFTNNIFGHRSTKYREYCPSNRNNHTFHHQYKICGGYDHILVDGDSEYNIKIDLDDLIKFYKS